MDSKDTGQPRPSIYRQLTIEEALQAMRLVKVFVRFNEPPLTFKQAIDLVLEYGVCTACGWAVHNSEMNVHNPRCPRCGAQPMHTLMHRGDGPQAA